VGAERVDELRRAEEVGRLQAVLDVLGEGFAVSGGSDGAAAIDWLLKERGSR